MQVQVNANHTVQTDESLERWARTELTEGLSRFRHEITSVEVHLSDQNSDRLSPDHKRCLIEARLVNHAPMAVNHAAPRLDEAFRGAADKLKRALEHSLGRLRDHRMRDSIRHGGLLAPEDEGFEPAPGGSAGAQA
jgi:ribosome-associated translation inhibitor RaiA